MALLTELTERARTPAPLGLPGPPGHLLPVGYPIFPIRCTEHPRSLCAESPAFFTVLTVLGVREALAQALSPL